MTPFLQADLDREEACRLSAYPDSRGVWTIGYGHTGREVHPGLVWTQQQANAAVAIDIAHVCTGLSTALPWWRELDDVRQDVLVAMGFQMGLHGLLQFQGTLEAVKAHRFDAAATRMLASQWAKSDSPARASRMAMQMRSGVRAWARPASQSTAAFGHDATLAAVSGPEIAA